MALKKQWLFFCIAFFLINGIPLHAVNHSKEYAIVSPTYESGMFSNFLSVIGMLHFFDKGYFKGLKVDYGQKGLYYVPALGPNWWEYYFDPIVLGDPNPNKAIIKKYTWDDCANAAWAALLLLDFQRSHELFKKYIRIKPEFLKEADEFAEEQFKSPFVIGIHYRGTDKMSSGEGPRVTYLEVIHSVNEVIIKNQLQDYQIFVATDEAKFLNYIKMCYPERVIYLEAIRSNDNKAIHLNSKNPFQMGREALIDALLLSKCSYLLRTSSNLSFCASIFNPNLKVRELHGKAN